ncbi:eukaryotic translation initiation factor-like protein 3 subunit B [Nadsonia fulvescens var. elongata DSM 6958]|uniref:Eukaryotic translation initiation factor 3 subunit B n=1 Tax=Nadsonia fulvescens var. elongata DSM 6958 TaxID=857566 RepID=A0A1E3PN29_9ASCO|nr:eukaryotic translation initiation factor-like protein 3 subunit B [Nadsonia fulvescens var. elongata DSM 6958]
MDQQEINQLIDQIDFTELEEKYSVANDDSFDNFVVVDGAPIVPEAKAPVLIKVLKKLFSTTGTITEDGFVMPLVDGKSKGFIFIEYDTAEQANETVKVLNNKKLDQKHTLLVNKFADIEKYGVQGSVDEEWSAPELEPFTEQPHLKSWLTDAAGRDQFLFQTGINDSLSVCWNSKNDAQEIIKRDRFTDKPTSWSPLGTYLLSIHKPGVQIWGGSKLERLGRFPHFDVTLAQVSPKENYLVTFSPIPISLPEDRTNCPFTEKDVGKRLVIWDMKTFLPMRSFALPPNATKDNLKWPFFKWSGDDKYVARIVPGESLSVFETSTMGLIGDKKTIKVPGIINFEFSPQAVKLEGRSGKDYNGDHVIAYWTPEMNNQAARVTLINVPTKQVIQTRNLVNVVDCQLHWQDQGKFLCVKVDRHTKSKKSVFTNLEFFRLTEKGTPVEVIELKESVDNFAWEPKSDRFVIISSVEPAPNAPVASDRFNLSFYAFERSKGIAGKWLLVKTFDKKVCNSLYWSPNGRFVVAAHVRSSSACEMEIYDMDYEGEKKDANKDLNCNIVCIASAENYGMCDLRWDPSGRYIATWSSAWVHGVDNGYKIFDFKGQLVREASIERFLTFSWRPRPESLLTKDQRKKITKNLKDYSRIFEEEDAMEASEASRELITMRRRLLEEWRAWNSSMLAKLESLGLIGGSEEEEEEFKIIEEIKDEVIEEKEEVVE